MLSHPDKSDARTRLHQSLAQVDALMSKAVYEALFDATAKNGPRQVLEIGTAHGAGTIALALGAEAGGHDTRITTVDTLQALPDIPSSRAEFGDVTQNREIVLGNFRHAGVENRITLHVGRSESYTAQADKDLKIDMLILDADGRIDRDLVLFGHHLAPGALIVVDDIDGRVNVALRGGRLAIDLKHVISEKLTKRLVEEGYLVFERRVIDTSFFHAPAPQAWDNARLLEIALDCYRELVFLDTAVSPVMTSTFASVMRDTKMLQPFYGHARKVYRKFSGRASDG